MTAHDAMDESALLQRARAGDAMAFEELVAPHRAALHARGYRMLASAHDADDALQETSEAAETLGLSVAAVDSQLQRARATLARRLPDRSQQAVRAELGTEAERRLVADLVAAWEVQDAGGLRRAPRPRRAAVDAATARPVRRRRVRPGFRHADAAGPVAAPHHLGQRPARAGLLAGFRRHLRPGRVDCPHLDGARIGALTCFLPPLAERVLRQTDELGSAGGS
ncbi:hypothetical protein [Georgenia sp. Marseille-Q6866]